MNKRANLYLNMGEFLFFGISFIGMSSYLQLTNLSFLIKTSIFMISSIAGLLFIAIELFLFLLMKKQEKVFYLIFLLLDILVGILVNNYYPFMGFIVFLAFCLIKDILRIVLVNKIYIPKEFDYYCKLYGIKIKDFKKKRKVVPRVHKKKEYIEIPVEKVPVKVKSERKRTKSLEESI